MRGIIDRVGPFTLTPERDRFWMLVRSIISQQISIAAARTVRRRVQDLVTPHKVTAENLLQLNADTLRGAGVSKQKASYILDLAAKVDDGTVRLARIGRRSNEQVIDELVQVKGIGRWTAEMFLMFALGRLDVFPIDDLGIRRAIEAHYGVDPAGPRTAYFEIAAAWNPHESIASWYCWRSLDAEFAIGGTASQYPV